MGWMTGAGRGGLRHGQASRRECAQQGTGGAWPPRFGRMRSGIGDKMESFGDISIGDLCTKLELTKTIAPLDLVLGFCWYGGKHDADGPSSKNHD